MSLGIKKPTEELSVGKILDQSVNVYLTHFTHFFLPFLIVGLVVGVFSAAVNLLFPLPPAPTPTASPEVILMWLPKFLSTLAITLGLTVIVSSILYALVIGMAVKYTSDFLERGSADPNEVFKFTLSKLVTLLIAAIITGILTIIGLILLIIPGIIIRIIFALVTPVIMIEQTGAIGSLGRSKKLVNKRWLKTFALLLIIGIILVLISGIVGLIGSPFSFLNSIITNAVTALVYPIYAIALTLLYYSMIARETPPPQK
jgi:hypothetical protein